MKIVSMTRFGFTVGIAERHTDIGIDFVMDTIKRLGMADECIKDSVTYEFKCANSFTTLSVSFEVKPFESV